MAGIHFDITGDNSNFLRRLREVENGVKNTSKQIEQSGLGIEELFNRMTRAAAAFGAGFTAKELISNIAQVRGEFQQLEVAFKTMLGSEDKANALMQQLVKTAATTPFDLQGVANGAKQLLAYGENVENVNDDLIRLGNIAAGLSQPLGDIVYLYGTTMTQGRLYTADLNQFTGRGIPMIRELAKVFGVAEGEVKSLVEAGKVGFPEVQKVIQNLTNEGGMFYNLMQEQSKTITGQISNIEDAVSTMFNEIGKANEGIINEALSGVSYLVENYEKVGKVLVGLVATYGVYKVAVMTVTALQALQASGIAALTIAERAHYGWLVLQTTAQKALNAVMFTNPYVLLATAVVGLGAAMWSLSDNTTSAERALDSYNKKIEKLNTDEEDRKRILEGLVSTINSEVEADVTKLKALKDIEELYPALFRKYVDEKGHIQDLIGFWKAYNEEVVKSRTQSKQAIVESLEQQIKSAEWAYNLAKKENNRSEMKVQAQRIEDLKNELANARKDVLSEINVQLEVENRQETKETTYQEDLANAKAEWEKAKKGYESLIKDQTATSKQVKEAKDKMEASEKAYKDLGGVTGSELTRQENLAKKQKENQEKLDGQLLSLRRQNQQDEINLMKEGTEKKLEQIDFDYQKQLDAIRKQEEEWSKAGNGKLTDKQVREISEAYANAESMRDKDITNVTKEQLKAEQQALNDYLKEYGTFQQQKLAIAQEYSEKIRKAQEESGANSAQVKLLEKQRDVAIQNKETEAIKANIDWVTVFGEFGSMFSDMVKPALDEAKKYVRTDKFKNSDQASQKSLIDAISQMEKSLGGTSGVNFKKLGEDVKAYHTAEQNRINAIEIETAALEKLKKSQDDYAKAQKSGTEEEKQVTANALDIARQNADIASANVKTQTDIANQAQRNVTDTATRLKASMENLLGGLQQISSGGLYNAYSGIIKTVNGFKDVIGKTSESLQEVPIVGWILSIIDVLKDGLSDLVGGLLDAVLNAVSGIISDVLSGDLFVTIGNSLKNGIGNILNAISFGGFNSLFGIGGNKKEVEEAINRLTDRNETLQTAIEDLTDEMKASKGTQSVAAYRDAYKYQKETIDNYKRIAQEQARYSGSHHSWNYYWGGFSQEQIDRLSGKIGRDWNGDIWNLTPEEMKMLRETVDMWETIQNTGKGGYGDRLTDKLNDYIDQAGTLEELTNELYEGLTGMSFDSMYDSFVDNLMDMKYDAKAASEDISEYFMRAMLSNKIGELYSEKLEEWWEKFGASMEDNELTEEERKALQDEYMKYVDEAMKLRDELAAATGYDKISQEAASQSASSKGFQTMSQDTGEELNGRFTALQVSNEEIKSQMINVVVGIGSLVSISTEGNATLGNILNQHVITNGYLEDIVKYTKPILELGSKLDKIVDNTKNM
ncbi:tape measure protein [Phocaeicola dorei]|uniref:tape measure protein n=1 Tax=Phocaeicola dorei TaxID=357276 RepID=UPI001F32620A|nr:tape measure protein [Phocaeicola dorei]MCE8434347.1 tape measure protein [Phocaeicola dorei]